MATPAQSVVRSNGRSPKRNAVPLETSKRPRMGLLAWAWILVLCSVPVHQLIYVEMGAIVRYVPVLLGLGAAALGRFASYRAMPGLLASGLLMVAGGLVSGFSTSVTASTAVAVWLAILVVLIPGCVVFQIRRDQRFLPVVVKGFLGVQLASSLVALFQGVGVTVLGFAARGGRSNGLAYHPNILGLAAVAAVLLCLDQLLRGVGRRGILAMMLVVNVGALVLSGSLSAMMSLAVGLLCFGALVRPWVLVAAGGALLGIGAVIGAAGGMGGAIVAPVADRTEEVVGASGEGVASLLVRLDTYQFAIDRIESGPIVGTGMDPAGQATVSSELVVHNMVLRAWMQGGIFFGTAVVGLIVALTILAVRGIRSAHGERRMSVAPSAIIVAYLAFGMTSTFYNQPHYWLPVLVASAVLWERKLGSRAPDIFT